MYVVNHSITMKNCVTILWSQMVGVLVREVMVS